MPRKHLSVLVALLAVLLVGIVVVGALAASEASDFDPQFDALSLTAPLGLHRTADGETEILIPPCIGAVRTVMVGAGRRTTWTATGFFRGDTMALGHAPPGLIESSPYAEPPGTSIDVFVVGGRGLAVAHDARLGAIQRDTVWLDGRQLTPVDFSRRVSRACRSPHAR